VCGCITRNRPSRISSGATRRFQDEHREAAWREADPARAGRGANWRVYFDPAVAMEEKIISANTPTSTCCSTPGTWSGCALCLPAVRHAVGNREVAMKRLNTGCKGERTRLACSFRALAENLWQSMTRTLPKRAGREARPQHPRAGVLPDHHLRGCEHRVPLWDEMEQCFASRKIQQRGARHAGEARANPKSEIRSPKQIRSPKPEAVAAWRPEFRYRISGFLLIRVSAFGFHPRPFPWLLGDPEFRGEVR